MVPVGAFFSNYKISNKITNSTLFQHFFDKNSIQYSEIDKVSDENPPLNGGGIMKVAN